MTQLDLLTTAFAALNPQRGTPPFDGGSGDPQSDTQDGDAVQFMAVWADQQFDLLNADPQVDAPANALLLTDPQADAPANALLLTDPQVEAPVNALLVADEQTDAPVDALLLTDEHETKTSDVTPDVAIDPDGDLVIAAQTNIAVSDPTKTGARDGLLGSAPTDFDSSKKSLRGTVILPDQIDQMRPPKAASDLTAPIVAAAVVTKGEIAGVIAKEQQGVSVGQTSPLAQIPPSDTPQTRASMDAQNSTRPPIPAPVAPVSPQASVIQTAMLLDETLIDSDVVLTESRITMPTTSQTTSVAQTAGPPTQAAAVAQQIATAIVQTSGSMTQIALNPEELGKVRIVLSNGDAGLSVSILAERPETADLMRRNLDHLSRELRDLGYDNPSFSFDDQPGDPDEQSGNGQQSARQSDPSPADVQPTQHTRVTISTGLDLKL